MTRFAWSLGRTLVPRAMVAIPCGASSGAAKNMCRNFCLSGQVTLIFRSFASHASGVARKGAASARRTPNASPSPLLSRAHTLWRAAAARAASTSASAKSGSAATGCAAAQKVRKLTHPVVGKWLLFSAALVYGIVVVGGITRLTESGLSITEWNVIRGMKWPSSQEEWEIEFTKYQQSPEYKLLNHNITLHEFKSIFYWEWFHRNLGRTIGMVFLLPTLYFTFTRPSAARVAKSLGSSRLPQVAAAQWMSPTVKKAAWTCCVLVGFQGALGWYMVKSGLENDILDTPNATPRVSQYRLTAHLGSAFVIYAIALWQGIRALSEWKLYVLQNGLSPEFAHAQRLAPGQIAKLSSFARGTHLLAAFVFLTAMSGAFVAGLDAGLVYNTWPLMGDRFVPPFNEMFRPILGTSTNGHAVLAPIDSADAFKPSKLFRENRWRNVFENQVTVQFDHRILAYATFSSAAGLWLWSMRLPLPPPVKLAAHGVMGIALGQAALGICTLLYFVPLELAAAHQGGSLALLTSAMWLMHKTSKCLRK